MLKRFLFIALISILIPSNELISLVSAQEYQVQQIKDLPSNFVSDGLFGKPEEIAIDLYDYSEYSLIQRLFENGHLNNRSESVKTDLSLSVQKTNQLEVTNPVISNQAKALIMDGALDFGGTNAYVSFGNPAKLHLSSFTIETRFRRDGNGLTTTTGTGGISNVIPLITRGRDEAENANADINFFLGINDTSDVLVADFEEGAGGSNPSENHPISGTTVITNGVWHHAAATYDGTKWQLFLNGVLEAELVVNEPVAAAGNQIAAIASALNTAGTADGFFDGALDEVRIWNSALTQADIRSNANLEITSATGLVARWGLNEGTGVSVGDSATSPANGTIIGSNQTWISGSPIINLAPEVNAGIDKTVNLLNNATLEGTVTDDGLLNAPTTLWTQVSGPGTTTFGDATLLNTTASFSVDGIYVLRLTANDGENVRSDDLTITFDNTSNTVMFQEGMNGYNGTEDTFLRETDPDTSQGTKTNVEWDLNTGNTDLRYALVKFNNLFGSGAGQIPAGVFITSATLSFRVYDTGNDALLNEALVSWDESSTFNNFGGEPDVQPDEFGNLIGIALGNSSSTQSIDVTESLKDWYEGNSTNNGWIFRPAGTNSVLFRSSEYNSIPTDRPKLSVTYTTVQPNRTPEKPTLVSPANQATGVSTSPTLNVNVSDPDGNPLTVTYYGREVTSTPGSDFTIVVLPDTQFYSSELNGGTKQMFKDQTQWVVDQRASRNIVFVTHLGDCVEHGDNNGNPIEWNNANEAISLLENPTTTTLTHGIPYGIVVGNHDQSPTGDADGMTTFYNQFFGTARFAGRSYYGGHYSINNDNHYQLFSASGLDFIIIHFEYDTSPEPAVLAWANNLLQTYSNRRAIISTHHIVNQGNPGLFSPQGQEIYDALKGNSNLFLMLGGHTGEEGQRADTFNTNTVYSLLSNYQARTNGGNGWLRSMTFSPANNQIQVETYSPTLNQSETDANSQFNLSYDMTGSGNNFTIIGTNNLVMGPTSDSMVWNGLKNSTKYEWYVEVSDGQVTNTSPVWEFETGSFEGDVAGITGNGAIEPNDVVQMRLFQIGFSSFDPSTNQFQRADSAPIGTFGDGCITPADIVQTRLYQIGFNSLTAAGGPTIENCPTTSLKKNDSGTSKLNKDFGDEVIRRASRSIQVNTTSGNAGKQVQVDLIVDALGDESEYGFRVNFDSKVLTYQNTTAGNVNAGKTLCNQTSPGVLLCSVGLFEDRGDGSNRLIGELVAGKNQILAHLNFSLADKAVSGTTTDLKISNSSAADDSAGNLAVIGKNGTVRITGSRSASVQGKILNQSNKTISGAIVQMTDEDGVINKTRTNSFGYYQFENVTIGEKYIFNIFAKGYRFTPQTVKLTESLTDQHFIVN